MTRSSRKFIAVLMLLWLPLFSGNALAATISMQLPQGGCNESDMSQMMMADDDMGDALSVAEHHDGMPAATDERSPS